MTDAADRHEQGSGAGDDGPTGDVGLPGAPHDAVGAYLLDALPEDERAAFARHLPDCDACRAELTRLDPTVGLLPRLFEGGADLDGLDERLGLAAPVPAPSPGLRDRILAAARAEADGPALADAPVAPVAVATPASAPEAAPTAETVRVPVTPPADADQPGTPWRRPPRAGGRPQGRRDAEPTALPARPRGRIRPGVPAGQGSARDGLLNFPSRVGFAGLAAAVLGVVAVGAVLWALALQGRVDDRGREIAALEARVLEQDAELSQRQQGNNAASWTLRPVAEAPAEAANATGNLFYSDYEAQVVLVVEGLPPLPPNQVYQLWWLGGSGGEVARPSDTFRVETDEEGVLTISGVARDFEQVAVSQEPEGGSTTPTEVLLVGQFTANG